MKKVTLVLIWLVIASLGFVTLLSNIDLNIFLKNTVKITSSIQRFSGLTAYSLLFIQILLGGFMNFWRSKIGSFALKFHVFNGVLAYVFVLLHVFSMVALRYFGGQGIDPYYVFVDVCVMCPKGDWGVNLGRIGFWFLTIAVSAGLFRAFNLFMRKNWRELHILNYVVFLVIGIHSLMVGEDIGYLPYSLFHGPALVIVICLVIYKTYQFVKNSNWKKYLNNLR